MKSRWRQLNGLFAALLLVIMGAAWLVLAPAQLGGQSTYVIVNGNSMEPVMHYGDLVILRSADDYQSGEIVTYRHPEVGIVIHRIIGRDGERYIFRGDHNSWTDSYHPDRGALLGRLWLRIPAVGQLIGKLHSPFNMALLVFVMGSIIMATTIGKPGRKQSLTHGGARPNVSADLHMPLQTSMRRPPAEQIDSRKEHVLFGSAVLTFISLLLALVAFKLPLTRSISEDIAYTQSGDFSYSAAAPAGVYDAGQLKTGDPVFLKLINAIDLSFVYHVSAEQARDLGGTYQLTAELGDSDGWRRTIELGPPQPFNGDTFTVQGRLDLAYLAMLTRTLEQQAAVEHHQYTLAIVPHVTLTGQLAGQALNDSFTPRLAFKLDELELQVMRDTLAETDPFKPIQSGMLKQTYDAPNTIGLLGLHLPVATARWLPLIGVVFAAGCALLFGRRMALATHGDEASRIQFKYGSLLIAVAGNQIAPADRVVEVATIDDLAKLAERDDRVILYERRGVVSHYFLQDGGVTYHYQATPTGSAPLAMTEARHS